jgi:predicted ATPase/DNA-binding winged helix-turn-helix (wHTH) protein
MSEGRFTGDDSLVAADPTTMSSDPDQVVDFGPFRLFHRHRKLYCGQEEIHLGGRAMDVLLALARQKGELVSKEELFEAAWPHVSVHESNLKVTVASVRRALREFAPSFECITTIVGRGYRLGLGPPLERLLTGHGSTSTVARPSLPELGTVVGRDQEIGALRDALDRNRLVTVVGAGGIGKTTVAVAVAQLLEDDGGGSVTFVDLGRIASADFVTPSLASALGVSSNGTDSLPAIVSILERQKAVLVLDTCEHVRNAVAHICDVVLARTPNVRILATSREVLRAQHEHVVWLEPLDVPPPDRSHNASEVMQYAAPQLLAARAREQAGYEIQDRDAPAVAEICRRLDGAPLAIELVSTRLANRSADVVLRDLDDRFRTLRRDMPGAPLRQQTLRATLEWSYALLTRTEAAVVRSLSIFAGSFDTDSVAGVVAHRGITPAEALDALAGLRAKSMASMSQSDATPRYRLLDSTRAFAAELLESLGEADAAAASHARLQLAVLTRAANDLATKTARQWHALYAPQADDLRCALDWSLHRGGDTLMGIELTAAGLPLWRELSLAVESRTNCERALTELARVESTDDRLRLKLTVELATSTAFIGDRVGDPVALFESALQLAQRLSDAQVECQVLGILAQYPLRPGSEGGVAGTLEQMRSAALRTNERTALWEQEYLCAEWEALSCEFASARSRLERICAEMRESPPGPVARFHVHQEARSRTLLVALHCFTGNLPAAIAGAETLAKEIVDIGHGVTLIHCLGHGILWTMVECQQYATAAIYAEILKDAVVRHGMAAWIPVADCYSESIAALSGTRRSPEALRRALDNLATGLSQIGHQSYYATIATAMVAIGEPEDAARAVDFVFRSEPQRWIRPEFRRLRAATERAFGRDAEAETSLREAIDAADQAGIPAYKLRAAFDLATLLKDAGARGEARRILAPAYQHFSDGSTTKDLRDARRLLRQLESR